MKYLRWQKTLIENRCLTSSLQIRQVVLLRLGMPDRTLFRVTKKYFDQRLQRDRIHPHYMSL